MLKKRLLSLTTACVMLASMFAFNINNVVFADASFIVDDLGDAGDDNPGDGICATAGAVCTLRAAMEEIWALPAALYDISFSVSGTITLTGAPEVFPNGTTVNGPGAGSLTIDFNGNSGFGFGGGEYHELNGVTLTGASNSCIDFNAGNSVVANNVITDCGNYGIEITPAGFDIDGIEISGNTIHNTQYEGIFVTTGAGNISDIQVTGNTIYDFGMGGVNNRRNAVDLYDVDAFSISGVVIDSNTITGHSANPAVIVNTSGGSITVSNNVITGGFVNIQITNSGGATVEGNTGNDADYGILVSSSSPVDVLDNTINDAVSIGILVSAGNGHTISGNTVNNPGGNGILIQNSNSHTVSGNTVDTPASVGIGYINSDNNVSTGNTVLNSSQSGLQMGGGNDPANACTGNTFTNETLTGNNYGFTIGDSAGTTDNTLSNSVISGSGSFDILHTSPGEDTLYIVDTTFDSTTVAIGGPGIVDVTFNVNVRASHNDYNLEDVDVTAIQTATDVETVVGTTNTLGYVSTALNYQITSESPAGLDLNEFEFIGVSGTFGTSDQNPPLTLSAAELTPDVSNFDSPVFAEHYYASYTPINVGGTDYNDRLVYAWALAGDGIAITNNGTPVAGATGENGFDFATIDITGGDHAGEKWTLVGDQAVFTAEADVNTWLDQHSEVGVGNYTVTNEFFTDASPNIENFGNLLDYGFGLPGLATVAAGGTDPGYLKYGNGDFQMSLSSLSVDGVDYADGLYFVGAVNGEGFLVDADDTVVSMADGTNSFDFVLASLLAGDKLTILVRTDAFTTSEDFVTWADTAIGPDSYTVDYESLGDGNDDLRANGFTNNYSFRLPIFSGVTVTIADGETDPGYLTVGAGPEPVVTLTTSANTFGENGGSLTATATLAEVTDKDVTVNFSFGGTATNAFEYTRSAESVTIPAGETTNSITLTGINNATYAENKTVILGIDYAVNASSNTPQATTLTILNDDDAPSNGGGAIGKLHEEEEEEPEEQEEQNSSVVPTETVETNETREATNTITNFISEAIESINEGSGTYETIDNALSDYREASTPQNVYLPESILKNLTGDPDGDGFTTAEEIYMGTDPNKFNEAPNFPSITNLDGKIVGDFPSFRLTSAAGDTVEVFLVNADNEEISLGLTTIDERNKGEIHASYPLPDGVYFAVPKGNDGYGAAVRFTVDAKKAIAAPQFYGPEFISVKDAMLGEWNSMVAWVIKYWDTNYEEFDDVAFWAKQEKLNGNKFLIIKGSAAPNSTIYLTLKSVIYSSVVLSDASGNFEVRMYGSDIDFDNENHSVLGYAVNEDNTILSSVSSLLLTK